MPLAASPATSTNLPAQAKIRIKMREIYTGKYRDQHGEENILIHNDGKILTTVIQCITFTIYDLFSICPQEPELAQKHESFSTFTIDEGRFCSCDGGELSSCALGYSRPILVLQDNQTQQAMLHLFIEIGPPNDGPILVWNKKIQLKLVLGDQSFRTRCIKQDFEAALNDLLTLRGRVVVGCCEREIRELKS